MDTIEEMSLNELERIEDGTKVTVKATIVSLAPVRAVSTGKVQDVIISDPSGTVNLSVWEDNVNKLEVGKTYKFSSVYVRSYQGVKSITLSRQSTYETIEGGNIITVDEIETEELQQAQIIGSQHFMIHVSCVNCSGKLLIDGNSSSAHCSNCKILQLTKGRHFEVAANILVQSKDGEKNNLKICTENILKLIPDLEVSQSSRELEDKLLYAPKMNIIYTKKTYYVKNINIEKK